MQRLRTLDWDAIAAVLAAVAALVLHLLHVAGARSASAIVLR